MRRLFRRRFPEFQAAYEQRYAPTFGRFRLPLIVRAASAFRVCGDWSQGIARIAATVLRGIQVPQVRIRPISPLLLQELYLPLGGALRRLCPSCAQKRTLLLGEYLSEDLLLRLPHRQAAQVLLAGLHRPSDPPRPSAGRRLLRLPKPSERN